MSKTHGRKRAVHAQRIDSVKQKTQNKEGRLSQRQPLQQPHGIARCVKNVVPCKSSTAASRVPAPSFHPLLFSFIFPSFLSFFLSLLLCSLPMPRCPVAHDKTQEPLVHSLPQRLYLNTLHNKHKTGGHGKYFHSKCIMQTVLHVTARQHEHTQTPHQNVRK